MPNFIRYMVMGLGMVNLAFAGLSMDKYFVTQEPWTLAAAVVCAGAGAFALWVALR